MRILAIDTSLGACSVAVTDNGTLLAHAFEVLGRGHAERLVPMVNEVIAAAGLACGDAKLATIDLVAVTVGPGTFTGVRIGVAAARGFALAFGVSLCGVTSTEAVADAVFARHDAAKLPDRLAVLHDARRGEIYMQLFERPAGPNKAVRECGPPDVVGRDRVLGLLPSGPLALAGTGVDLVGHDLLRQDPARVLLDDPCYPDAVHVARICARSGADTDARNGARPLYLRAPDAKLPSTKRPAAG